MFVFFDCASPRPLHLGSSRSLSPRALFLPFSRSYGCDSCFMHDGECVWVDLWNGQPGKADTRSIHGSSMWTKTSGAYLYELASGEGEGRHPHKHLEAFKAGTHASSHTQPRGGGR
jgi:hypothetical protein